MDTLHRRPSCHLCSSIPNRNLQPGLHEGEHEQLVEGARDGLRPQEESRRSQEVSQDVPGSAGEEGPPVEDPQGPHEATAQTLLGIFGRFSHRKVITLV